MNTPNPIRPNPIRVMIVDDHDMVRKGLAIFLKVNADLELVAEARNGQEALRLCEQVQPDVVLMDLVMPEMDGTTATRLIRERWPQVQVVALTSFYEQELVREAFQAGVVGYLLKDITIDDLAEAIRAAHAGWSALAPEAAQALMQSAGQGPTPGHDLTSREREALTSMVEGLTDPECESLDSRGARQRRPAQTGCFQSRGGGGTRSDRSGAAAQPFDKLCVSAPRALAGRSHLR